MQRPEGERGSGATAGAQPPRTVILIPIIHTQADMGALAPSVRRVAMEKLGLQVWKRNVNVIAQMWAEIGRAVKAWKLPWTKVRLYQDGLPRCERETEIVNELAAAGSRNHQLLLALVQKGATLMGTESPDLLLEEYQLMKQLLAAKNPKEAAQIEARQALHSGAVLRRRDRYIAKRINDSLRPGEIGILFLGMLHSLDPHLAKDIQVTYPFRRPASLRLASLRPASLNRLQEPSTPN